MFMKSLGAAKCMKPPEKSQPSLNPKPGTLNPTLRQKKHGTPERLGKVPEIVGRLTKLKNRASKPHQVSAQELEAC